MSTHIRTAWLAGFLSWAIATPATATQSRGRVDYRDPVATFPMVNATVQLCSAPNACVSYVTGTDGMNYLAVNPGQYQLVVNGIDRGLVAIPDAAYYDMQPVPGN